MCITRECECTERLDAGLCVRDVSGGGCQTSPAVTISSKCVTATILLLLLLSQPSPLLLLLLLLLLLPSFPSRSLLR